MCCVSAGSLAMYLDRRNRTMHSHGILRVSDVGRIQALGYDHSSGNNAVPSNNSQGKCWPSSHT